MEQVKTTIRVKKDDQNVIIETDKGLKWNMGQMSECTAIAAAVFQTIYGVFQVLDMTNDKFVMNLTMDYHADE